MSVAQDMNDKRETMREAVKRDKKEKKQVSKNDEHNNTKSPELNTCAAHHVSLSHSELALA